MFTPYQITFKIETEEELNDFLWAFSSIHVGYAAKLFNNNFPNIDQLCKDLPTEHIFSRDRKLKNSVTRAILLETTFNSLADISNYYPSEHMRSSPHVSESFRRHHRQWQYNPPERYRVDLNET